MWPNAQTHLSGFWLLKYLGTPLVYIFYTLKTTKLTNKMFSNPQMVECSQWWPMNIAKNLNHQKSVQKLKIPKSKNQALYSNRNEKCSHQKHCYSMSSTTTPKQCNFMSGRATLRATRSRTKAPKRKNNANNLWLKWNFAYTFTWKFQRCPQNLRSKKLNLKP